jgi:hypothetical protein
MPGMKALPFLVAIALALADFGCKSAEDYARNNTATAGWLDAHAGQPAINVAGQWHSDDWGDALFKQKGNRVTGILGDRPIGGVLSGRTLYLAITDDGWTDYTAVLEPRGPRTLAGQYSDGVPFVAGEDSHAIQLTRTSP